MSVQLDGDWLVDRSKRGEVAALKVLRRLHSARTEFQQAELIETETYGRALVLDGSIQAAAADEYIYHESLVHPALLACQNPARVAVLGGGEGATIREVLKHRGVEKVTMIDIDREVVDFCRRYLPSFGKQAFEDERLELVFEDARQWMADQAPASLDAVIIDITEPLEGGPAFMLFTREFYRLVRRALVPNGVMVVQAGPADPVGHIIFSRIFCTVEAVFDSARALVSYIPSFADQWGFVVGLAADARLPDPEEIDGLIKSRTTGELRFYDGQTHAHISSLPLYLRRGLAGELEPFTDNDPPRMGPGIR